MRNYYSTSMAKALWALAFIVGAVVQVDGAEQPGGGAAGDMMPAAHMEAGAMLAFGLMGSAALLGGVGLLMDDTSVKWVWIAESASNTDNGRLSCPDMIPTATDVYTAVRRDLCTRSVHNQSKVNLRPIRLDPGL